MQVLQSVIVLRRVLEMFFRLVRRDAGVLDEVRTDVDPCTLQGTVPEVTTVAPVTIIGTVDVVKNRVTFSIRCIDVVEDAEEVL
jgi:hypothetical protein